MSRLSSVFVAFVASTVFFGCNSSSNSNRPAVVKVAGNVTYKQQPVAGATVLFSPVEKSGFAATGLTDSQGNYSLRTFSSADGAVPAQYKVTVSKHDMSTANPDLEDDLASELREDDSDEIVGPKSLLPERYSSIETSGLIVTVSSSEQNVFPFDLVD